MNNANKLCIDSKLGLVYIKGLDRGNSNWIVNRCILTFNKIIKESILDQHNLICSNLYSQIVLCKHLFTEY